MSRRPNRASAPAFDLTRFVLLQQPEPLGSRKSLSGVKASASAMADEEHAEKKEEVPEVSGLALSPSLH